jgi:hypothetical protein
MPSLERKRARLSGDIIGDLGGSKVVGCGWLGSLQRIICDKAVRITNAKNTKM